MSGGGVELLRHQRAAEMGCRAIVVSSARRAACLVYPGDPSPVIRSPRDADTDDCARDRRAIREAPVGTRQRDAVLAAPKRCR